ncbi:hypothetical protein JSE7799_02873 [Jannaschia seosinensis]|uniref:Uncharacterized protein n=1 Tax=Jannaschia seosinensis TaxID=313367 RepID=A0A0M7BE31_9RHOB|nr:hypothetical protein [Jannaschia seosinensis]CUH40143.1 hypothetical protein JSE7799_02873 [Jannaschia seosinensis]
MNDCFTIPGLGLTCLNTLSFRVAGYEIGATDPNFLAIVLILGALVAFVFKSPVDRRH